jgi:hypothetical protein
MVDVAKVRPLAEGAGANLCRIGVETAHVHPPKGRGHPFRDRPLFASHSDSPLAIPLQAAFARLGKLRRRGGGRLMRPGQYHGQARREARVGVGEVPLAPRPAGLVAGDDPVSLGGVGRTHSCSGPLHTAQHDGAAAHSDTERT